MNEGNVALPQLTTRRLFLEPITESHSRELFELFSDAELHRFTPQDVPTLEQQKERCVRWAKGKSPDESELWLNWAGRDKATGKVMAHFQCGVREDGVASVGYLVARAYQGRGLATEGLKLVFQFLNEVHSVREIKAWADTRNTASHRLAKRLGMSQIDFIKDAEFFKGSSSDEFVFSKVFDAN